MSLLRLVFGLLLVGASCFALTANADNSSAQASGQPAMTNSTAAPASAASAPAKHHRTGHKAAAAHQVNLNSADAAALAKVRGIGLKRANEIVAYRTKNGNFSSVADLKNVTNAKGKPLFSSKALARLEKRLTTGDAAPAASASASGTSAN